MTGGGRAGLADKVREWNERSQRLSSSDADSTFATGVLGATAHSRPRPASRADGGNVTHCPGAKAVPIQRRFNEKACVAGLCSMGGTGLEPVTPQLVDTT